MSHSGIISLRLFHGHLFLLHSDLSFSLGGVEWFPRGGGICQGSDYSGIEHLVERIEQSMKSPVCLDYVGNSTSFSMNMRGFSFILPHRNPDYEFKPVGKCCIHGAFGNWISQDSSLKFFVGCSLYRGGTVTFIIFYRYRKLTAGTLRNSKWPNIVHKNLGNHPLKPYIDWI